MPANPFNFFRPNVFMPSTPFTDPFYFARPMMNAMERAVEFPADNTPQGAPISFKVDVTDPGLNVTTGPMSMTISGTAQGGVEVGADSLTGTLFGTYHKSRGVSFSLDADKAPTENVWGETTYREKNERLFYVGAAKGSSAQKIAERMAREVNGRDDFRAKVTVNNDGSATINFTRR